MTDEQIFAALKTVDPDAVRLPTGFRLFALAILQAATRDARSREIAELKAQLANAVENISDLEKAATRAAPSADVVYYRYRHSETEKWHYGPTPQNWWECQALGVIADCVPKGDGND